MGSCQHQVVCVSITIKLISLNFFTAGSRGIQPSFSPGSYLRLPGSGRRPEQTAIDLLVNPSSPNGIIVFLSGGGSDHRAADFLALGLQNGAVRLALNLGKHL